MVQVQSSLFPLYDRNPQTYVESIFDAKPGDFVLCDQFVDRTRGRADTFFDGPVVTHLSSADTYDPELRRIALEVCREHGIDVHERGTIVIINGPRFSTKSESKWFSDAGWEVISMTQYPEAYLCREVGRIAGHPGRRSSFRDTTGRG